MGGEKGFVVIGHDVEISAINSKLKEDVKFCIDETERIGLALIFLPKSA
jgi:hypothetical protein